MPFPSIDDLPKILDCSNWVWAKPPSRDDWDGIQPEWWIGTDEASRRWLVKMTNSFYAYREHVFASLAQRLQISCQSSVYLTIPCKTAAPRQEIRGSESGQLGLWLMEEHPSTPCSEKCPLREVFGKPWIYETIRAGSAAGVKNFEDLIRGDTLGFLCGQFEPHDHFFTIDHEYVVIDNECMFSSTPCLNQCDWLRHPQTINIALDVCRKLTEVPNEELRSIAHVPSGYIVANPRNLFDDLCLAKEQAAEFFDLLS